MRASRLPVAALVLALAAGLGSVVGPLPSPATAAPTPTLAQEPAGERAAASSRFRVYDGATPLRRIAPGTPLKTRRLTYSVRGIPVPLQVTQVLYRTVDALRRPTVNVTSVIHPPASALGPLTGPVRGVVAYGSFYDSLNPADGPSYAIAGGTSGGASAVHAETALVAPFLLAGSAVVMADTQGRTADFAAGPEYGYTTLDSLRAVSRTPRTGVAPDADVALFGYSGGAIATTWAAALAPRYAPDVDRRLVGAAAGGVLVNPATNLRYIEGSSIWAGVLAMALVGAARGYEVELEPYLSAYGRTVFEELRRAPIADVLGAYPGLTWKQLATPRFPDPEQVPVYVRTVNRLNLGRAPTPTVPLFLGQGTGGELEGTPAGGRGIGRGDGVMVAGDVRTLARRYCDDGATVQYRQYPTSHFSTVALWLPEAIAWTQARLADVAAPSSCGAIAPGNSLAPLPVP